MSNSIVVLQARTSSSRLPAKVLLPIRGIPLVVLAAKRAGNTGRKVIVVTSKEYSDDELVATLASHQIEYFRGDLNNVLKRVVDAISDYDDETLVFRLTADNVFPDGNLLDEMEEDFLERGLNYLCCNGIQSGLPYGFSAELMNAHSLRGALAEEPSKYDQEHVTPSIIQKYGENYFQKYINLGKGNYRCTIDTIDDYLTITQAFTGVNDPIISSSFDLISRLEGLKNSPSVKYPLKKFVLGTVQLGMDYGVTNKAGQPTQKLSTNLVRDAVSNGVEYIDTANAYGDSEEVVGRALSKGWKSRVKVVTKLSPLLDCPKDADRNTIKAFVDASVYQSCARLSVQELDVLMLHRVSHLTDWGGVVWEHLMKLKKLGVICSLGASVQTPDELEKVLSNDDINFIQMPFNLLDWRWEQLIPKIFATKRRRKLVIHVRSVFLQGVLLSDDASHWECAHVTAHDEVRAWLDKQVFDTNSVNRADLCLNYVNSMEWVDGIVVGVDTLEQFKENIQYFDSSGFVQNQLQSIEKSGLRVAEKTLNPSLWRYA